jgi:hypothetical protein
MSDLLMAGRKYQLIYVDPPWQPMSRDMLPIRDDQVASPMGLLPAQVMQVPRYCDTAEARGFE